MYHFDRVRVPYELYFVENDAFAGLETQKAVAASLNATRVKFIDDRTLTHTQTTDGADVRCYIFNDLISEFNRLETERDDARESYRHDVAAFVENLPFEDGCVNVPVRVLENVINES